MDHGQASRATPEVVCALPVCDGLFLLLLCSEKEMAAFELLGSYRNSRSSSALAPGCRCLAGPSDRPASLGAGAHRTHIDTFADTGYINKAPWKDVRGVFVLAGVGGSF